jgi:DNA topoisomerase-1
VTTFLTRFFERYVDTGFTAGLEEQLDDISGGKVDWRAVMRAFWEEFSRAIEATKDLKISDVIDALDEELGPHFFPEREGGTDPRACPACGNGRLGLRLGRTGAFIGCNNYPECRFTKPLIAPGAEGEGSTQLAEGQRELGQDSVTGQNVSIRRGPYGLYVQLGEAGTDAKGKPTKPRRASLTREMDPEQMTLQQALALLSLPRIIGLDPETGGEILAGIGRFGPYVKLGATFQSLEPGDDVLTLGMNRAMDLLAKARAKVRLLGNHPKDAVPVEIRKGRFGPYAMHGKVVANLPRNLEMEAITLDEAVALLAEKGKELKPKAGAKGAKPAAKAKAAPKPKAATGAEAAAPKPAAKPKPASAKAKPKAAAPRKAPARATAAKAKPAPARKGKA